VELGGLTWERIGETLQRIGPTLLVLIGAALLVQVVVYFFLKNVLKSRHALPLTLLSPALVAILLFFVYPFFFNILLAFSDLRLRTFNCYSPAALGECRLDHLYGLDYFLKNIGRVFFATNAEGQVTGWGQLLQTQYSTFPVLLGRTLLWTALNVVAHVSGGLALALVLNQKIKFKGLYRALIVIPWAMPQVIVGLTWRTEFHSQYGFVNILLQALGIISEPISWLDNPFYGFLAVLFVNIWLGIPFYMVTLLGGLQSISAEYYEAAAMDGANAFERFKNVTIPLIRPILVPAITLDVIWTFNQFNVIFLMTEGGPQESTNILVTALYNAAFGRTAQLQLGFAAAFSLVIFAILFVFVLIWMRISGGLKEVYSS
jgi:arabinogalactan oligomer / maltooligosaccharide transport system permease protein